MRARAHGRGWLLPRLPASCFEAREERSGSPGAPGWARARELSNDVLGIFEAGRGVVAIARIEYDVFVADCPACTTLGLLADTWSIVVVFALGEGPRRYSELHER